MYTSKTAMELIVNSFVQLLLAVKKKVKLLVYLLPPQKTNQGFLPWIKEVMLQYFFKEPNHFDHTTI